MSSNQDEKLCVHGLDYEHYIDRDQDRRICHPPNCESCNLYRWERDGRLVRIEGSARVVALFEDDDNAARAVEAINAISVPTWIQPDPFAPRPTTCVTCGLYPDGSAPAAASETSVGVSDG